MSDGRPLILDDADVARFADMNLAIEAVENAFIAKVKGRLVAPPRHTVSFPGPGDLIFTIGGTSGSGAKLGFRVNNDFVSDVDDQFVAVWDGSSGRLEGLLLSRDISPLRTGAIGGVAIKYMSPGQATVAAVIGAGRQAAAQVEAAARVRPLSEIRVFSRHEAGRQGFAEAMTARMGVACVPAPSAEAAVSGADIVILATTSRSPVVRAEWLSPRAHVNTLGPRFKSGHETGMDIVERAELIATDSPDQIAAFTQPYFLAGTPAMSRMRDLADLVAHGTPRRRDQDALSLFCSVGLAGTEVLVAAAIIAAAKRSSS